MAINHILEKITITHPQQKRKVVYFPKGDLRNTLTFIFKRQAKI